VEVAGKALTVVGIGVLVAPLVAPLVARLRARRRTAEPRS
jgi:hypothetical protein